VVVAHVEEKNVLETALATDGPALDFEPFSNNNTVCKADRRIFRGKYLQLPINLQRNLIRRLAIVIVIFRCHSDSR
jgi:hypothetical protein